MKDRIEIKNGNTDKVNAIFDQIVEGDTIQVEGLFSDHRGVTKFLKKGKYKGDKLKVVVVRSI